MITDFDAAIDFDAPIDFDGVEDAVADEGRVVKQREREPVIDQPERSQIIRSR